MTGLAKCGCFFRCVLCCFPCFIFVLWFRKSFNAGEKEMFEYCHNNSYGLFSFWFLGTKVANGRVVELLQSRLKGVSLSD